MAISNSFQVRITFFVDGHITNLTTLFSTESAADTYCCSIADILKSKGRSFVISIECITLLKQYFSDKKNEN